MKHPVSPRLGYRFLPFYYGWVIVAAAFIETALVAGISNSQGVFLKPLLVDFGWTRAMVAGAFALSNVAAAILSPIMGMLADKYGPRALMAVDSLFTGGAYLLVSQMQALWQFYCSYGLLIGVGSGAHRGAIAPTISRWFVAKRGLAQGIVQAGAGLGTITIPPLATYLILTRDWRFAYIVMGLLLVVLVGSTCLLYRRSPQDMGLEPDGNAEPPLKQGPSPSPKPIAPLPTPPGLSQGSFTFKQAVTSKSFQLLAFAAMVGSYTQHLVLIHLVPHATDRGFSPAIAATFMSVLGMSNIIGKITMGLVSDRIGRRNSIIISFSLGAVMLFWLLNAQEAWTFYLFAAIYGFAYGSWIPMFPAIVGDLFGLGAVGAIYGAVSSSNALGGALGPFLGGYIFDITQSYNYAFLSAAMILIAGIGSMLFLHRAGPGRVAGKSPQL